MADVSDQIRAVVGPERFRVLVPSTAASWGISTLGTLFRGFFGKQLVVSGGALTGRDANLNFEVISGTAPVLGLVKRQEPFLSLGRINGGSRPLEPFFVRLGFEPARECLTFRSINGLFILYGRCLDRDAVALVATDAATEERISCHTRGLTQARSDLKEFALTHTMPEILGSGCDYLVQSRISGRQIKAQLLSETELARVVRAGLRTANALAEVGRHCRITHPAQLVPPGLLSAFDTIPSPGKACVTAAMHALGEWGKHQVLVGVPTHGDLWLENLFFDQTNSQVTGIIDWEDYDPNGVPLLDAIRLVVTSVASHRKVPVQRTMAEIWFNQDDFLSTMFEELCSIFQVSRTTLAWLGIAAWFSHIVSGLREPRPRDFHRWISDMCDTPGAAVTEWLAREQGVAAK